MKQVHTTATAVEKIRARAKELAKGSEMTYQQPLELASRHAGYENWHHVRSCLKRSPASEPSNEARSARQEGLLFSKHHRAYMDYLAGIADGVSIERISPRGREFHSVEIDGHYFSASASIDGPGVGRLSSRKRGHSLGWVQLGVAEIHFTKERSYFHEAHEAWFVCKYGPPEPRVFLGDLSPPVIHAVAHQFGIPIYYGEQAEARPPIESDQCWAVSGYKLFYISPAFQSLCELAKRHPRKVRGWGSGPYLGAWSEAALAGEYIPKDQRIDCDAENHANTNPETKKQRRR